MNTWKTLIAISAMLFFTTSVWAVPPESYVVGPNFASDPEFIDCNDFGMDFTVAAQWWWTESGKIHFDKDGKMVRINGFNWLSDQLIWNTSDPGKFLSSESMAGGDEHNHFIVEFDDDGNWVFYIESGVSWKAVIPGYGPISIRAGMFRWVFDEGTGEWSYKVTPNRNPDMEDLYNICVYLY